MNTATTDTEFVFETNRLPFWTVPFLNMLSLATSCVDAIFFQKSPAQQHLNADNRGINGLDHESSNRGWSMCDDSITAVSNPGHPMAEFYNNEFSRRNRELTNNIHDDIFQPSHPLYEHFQEALNL